MHDALAKQALDVLARPRGVPAAGRCGRVHSCASDIPRTPACPGSPRNSRRWQPPGEAGGERSVHPRRLPRPVRAAGSRAHPAARLEVPFPRAKPLELPDSLTRDAAGSSRCIWYPSRPSIARAKASPGRRSTAIISTSARRSTTRSRRCRTCSRTWSSPTAAAARRACSCARCSTARSSSIANTTLRRAIATSRTGSTCPRPSPPRSSPLINAPTLATLVDCDAGYSATQWQKQSFPARFHSKIEVHFDGIDTALYQPGPAPRQIGARSIPEGTQRGHVCLARARVDPRVRPLHERRPAHLQGPLGCDLRRGRR